MNSLEIEWVADLDLISFMNLLNSVQRIRSQSMAEQAQNMRAAFGAEAKDFTNYIKDLESGGTDQGQKNDAAALIARFGK